MTTLEVDKVPTVTKLAKNVFFIDENDISYISQNGKRIIIPKRVNVYVAKWNCIQLNYSGANKFYTKSFSANKNVLEPMAAFLDSIVASDVLYEHHAMPKTITTVRVTGYPPLVTLHNDALIVYNPFTKERLYLGKKTCKDNVKLAKALALSHIADLEKLRYTKPFQIIEELT